ncbi:MAG: hypothetical protein WAS27_01595 [Candidatus Saccharimonadales bacterium]
MNKVADITLTHTDFALPPRVVSRLDVAHMIADAERVDQAMTTTSVRKKAGASSKEAIVCGQAFAEFLALNHISFETSRERTTVIKQLHLLKDAVPVIHLTFAAEADPESLWQLSKWVRAELHPQAVIAVGLQPGLVAGVYVRTPNHVHDLSMRTVLRQQRGVLVGELEALRGAK